MTKKEDTFEGKPVEKFLQPFIIGSHINRTQHHKAPCSTHPVALKMKMLCIDAVAKKIMAKEEKEKEARKQASEKMSEYGGKTRTGIKVLLRRVDNSYRRRIEIIESQRVGNLLEIINMCNVLRFISVSELQWNSHLLSDSCWANASTSMDHYNGKKISQEEYRTIMFFAYNQARYQSELKFCRKLSKDTRDNLGKASKEMRRFFKDEYISCSGCDCIFHRSMLNMYGPQMPLMLNAPEEKVNNEGWSYTCLDCVSTTQIPYSSTYWSYKQMGHAPLLPHGNGGSSLAKTKTKRARKCKKKKALLQIEQASVDVTADATLDATVDQDYKTGVVEKVERVEKVETPKSKEQDYRENNSSSPTGVVMTNDDWVDFLQKSGSIIALNEYMDSVLGVDDDMISEGYDDVETGEDASAES
jgi:hypothetical protein